MSSMRRNTRTSQSPRISFSNVSGALRTRISLWSLRFSLSKVVGIVLWILQGVNGHVAVTLRYSGHITVLASMQEELAKLELIRGIDLPADLFNHASPRDLERCRRRVAVEAPHELRRHTSGFFFRPRFKVSSASRISSCTWLMNRSASRGRSSAL